jgi:hypothetical protein
MNRTRRILPLAAVLVLALSATALAKKPVSYVGKTKEGAKISFKLDQGWIKDLKTLAPEACGSAQGGDPKASLRTYWPPFSFKVGYKVHWKDTSGYTTYYNIRTRKLGRTIKGHLESNYSMLVTDGFGGYAIRVCESTSSFSAHPKR